MEQQQNDTQPETNVSNQKAAAPSSESSTPPTGEASSSAPPAPAREKKAPSEQLTLMRVLRLMEKLPADAAARVSAYIHHKHGPKA